MHCILVLTSLEIEAASTEASSYMEQLRYFSILLKKDYNRQLSYHARQTLLENQWNQRKCLPEANDIAKLLNYLECNEKKCMINLQKSVKHTFDINAYKLTTL